MDDFDNEEEKKKEIEIVNGDGSALNISPVYDHIKMDKPEKNKDKKKNIIVPKGKNKK